MVATTSSVTSGAAGAAIFASSGSRRYNYFEPRGKRATHYEDVTCDVQPDPERYLIQDWIISFGIGKGAYSKDNTRALSSNWHAFRAPDQEWERTHYQRQSKIETMVQAVIGNARKAGAHLVFDKVWQRVSPDQYVDALAIDYAHDRLAVGARCHGNHVENFWEGNTIASDPATFGFQNRFTGTSGNIHITWLGKLALEDGVLTNSTYMAEYAEGTGSLGSPHPDPNLDGWPNPNSGWPNVNTTRLARNNIKVSSSGDLCVLANGRRTITTANPYQKMVKPAYGGKSCWNNSL